MTIKDSLKNEVSNRNFKGNGMKAIEVTSLCSQMKWSLNSDMQNCHAKSLINVINMIMRLVIANSLKLNKFTSAEQICDHLIMIRTATSVDSFSGSLIDFDPELNTIISICDTLCLQNGVLSKFEKNGEYFYKLNHTDSV
jgi:hypothetical protein